MLGFSSLLVVSMRLLGWVSIIGLLIIGCEDDGGIGDDCKYCYELVTDADGNVVSEGSPEEFCGSDLDDVDGISDTDPDGNTVEWICDEAYKK